MHSWMYSYRPGDWGPIAALATVGRFSVLRSLCIGQRICISTILYYPPVRCTRVAIGTLVKNFCLEIRRYWWPVLYCFLDCRSWIITGLTFCFSSGKKKLWLLVRHYYSSTRLIVEIFLFARSRGKLLLAILELPKRLITSNFFARSDPSKPQ